MKNKYFKESNAMAIKSKNDDNYSDAFIRRENGECYSLWKGSLFDRLRFLFFGRLWIIMKSGETQPPVRLSTGYFIIKDWKNKAFKVSRPTNRRERRKK